MVVVVDHDTGTLVWAADGRSKDTIQAFFDQLGPQRTAQISHVSADAADYIAKVVTQRCPDAVRCADPFHIVQWANEAVDPDPRRRLEPGPGPDAGRDETRHRLGPTPPTPSRPGPGRRPKGSRFALWKNPENLTTRQKAKLDWITANEPRPVARLPAQRTAPADLRASRRRSTRRPRRLARLGPTQPTPRVRRPRTQDRRQREPILAAITHNMSNALVESINTKIRLLTRIAFGFHSVQALFAIAMLSLGGYALHSPADKPTHR